MHLYRVYIDNKKVVNRVYWAGSEDDETVKVKKQVTDVFTDETFPFPVNIWGTDMDNNVITFHQCSCEADWKDSSKIQNSILINKDFLRYIYDLDTATKTIEIFYKDGQAMPVVPLGSGINVMYITDMANSNFELQNTQAIYVTGDADDVWNWANSLDTVDSSAPTMPITKGKKLHRDDSYKFQFDSNKRLVSVTLFAHLERYQVWGTDKVYEEYTADFASELTNLGDTEIVVPKYDNHGNMVAQNVNKADIKEYVKVPKNDGSGNYDFVKLKDL